MAHSSHDPHAPVFIPGITPDELAYLRKLIEAVARKYVRDHADELEKNAGQRRVRTLDQYHSILDKLNQAQPARRMTFMPDHAFAPRKPGRAYKHTFEGDSITSVRLTQPERRLILAYGARLGVTHHKFGNAWRAIMREGMRAIDARQLGSDIASDE